MYLLHRLCTYFPIGFFIALSYAFVVLHGMLKVFEKENKIGIIEEEIIDFIGKFPYIEVDIAKNISSYNLLEEPS